MKWRTRLGVSLILINLLLAYGFQNLLYLSRGGGGDEFSSDSGDSLQQVITVGMLIMALVIGLFQRGTLLQATRVMAPWLLLLFLCLFSVFWSNHPELTARRAARLFVEFASLALLCASVRGNKAVPRIFVVASVTILCIDVALLLISPSAFTDIGFAGIHATKNTAGAFYAISTGIMYFAVQAKLGRWTTRASAVGLVLSLVLLYLSESKSNLFIVVPAIIGVSCLSILRLLAPTSRAITVLVTLSLIASAAAFPAVAGRELRETVIGSYEFTGRTQLWDYVGDETRQSWLTGLGYGALWQTGTNERELRNAGILWSMNQSHNGYLDTLAQTGVFGLILLGVAVLVSGLRVIFFASRVDLEGEDKFIARVGCYLLTLALLLNFSETSFVRSGAQVWISLLVALFLAESRRSLLRSRRSSALAESVSRR